MVRFARRVFILAIFFVSAFVISISNSSAEYFGLFSDGPSGSFYEDSGRQHFRLERNFEFEDPNGLKWPVPGGVAVDGASIPQVFWSIIGGPFSGSYLRASIIHDYYCDRKTRTAHDTHRNFYYGMRAAGVEEWKADAMYWAVRNFGPDWILEKRVVFKQVCSKRVGEIPICSSVPEIKDEVVEVNKVDLDDPELLSLALAKFNAISKTLKTSSGQYIDVSSSGLMPATLDKIDEYSIGTREQFSSKVVLSNPFFLGILSTPENIPLDKVSVWQGGVIPDNANISSYANWSKEADQDQGFQLKSEELGSFSERLNLGERSLFFQK